MMHSYLTTTKVNRRTDCHQAETALDTRRCPPEMSGDDYHSKRAERAVEARRSPRPIIPGDMSAQISMLLPR